MAKYQVGEQVKVRAWDGRYWTGIVQKVGWGLFGRKYLLEYGAHDLDWDYHFRKVRWFYEWRLF